MPASPRLRGLAPGALVSIANAWRIGGSANIAYLDGKATGKAPPAVLLTGAPGNLASPLTLSVSTPGPLGTAVLQLAGVATFTTAASDATVGRSLSAVATAGGASPPGGGLGGSNSLVLFLPAGQYDTSNAWSWNLGAGSVPGPTAVGLAPQDIVANGVVIADSVLARVHTGLSPGAGGAVTVTMPSNPWDGMLVAVEDADYYSFINSILVSANSGQTIQNPYNVPSTSPTTPTIRIPGQCVTWAWDALVGTWRVIADSHSGVLPSVPCGSGVTVTLFGRAWVKCSSTGAACTVNLPVAATEGLAVRVTDVTGTAGTHNITVKSSAANVGINNAPSTGLYAGGGPVAGSTGVVMGASNEALDFVFDSAGNGSYTGGIWWLTQMLSH
jgi:hypothetical protein